MRLNAIDWIALVLVIIGAINWLLVGLFNFDLILFLFGGVPIISNIIFIIVGLAGLWLIYTATRLTSTPRAVS